MRREQEKVKSQKGGLKTWTTPLLVDFILVAAVGFAGEPLSPEESARAIELADPNLVIELVAAEPDVTSPVAIAWDEHERLYVAEMNDYPSGPTAGRIRLLEDLDETGRYRKSTIFAEGLPYPNGVLPYKGGVYVTAAPNLLYLKDTDGDGHADETRVVLTGFAEGNPQLRINGLMWGRDNWIYMANGRSDGRVRRPDQPESEALALGRHDMRFHPETLEFERVAGFSQFGLTRDDCGERFLSWNTAPFRHVVIEEEYLEGNPVLADVDGVANIADPTGDNRLYPISPPPQTFNREPIHFFNASCGPVIYRGNGLGAAYAGDFFVCEPLTNLVHRRRLVPSGVTFIAKRAEEGREFLASRDPWFHPVNLANGPDGCLYVVDFYRQWVEHPQFVQSELGKDVDWRVGAAHGRIWRIRAKDLALAQQKKLGESSIEEIVDALAHPDGWRRDTAQRVIVERKADSVPILRQRFLQWSGEPDKRLGLLHVLWTLDGLDRLDAETARAAVAIHDRRIRAEAARLIGHRAMGEMLVFNADVLLQEEDARFLFEATLAQKQLIGDAKADFLTTYSLQDELDPWARIAILAAVGTSAGDLLEEVEFFTESSSAGDEAQLLEPLAMLACMDIRQNPANRLLEKYALDDERSFQARFAILAGVLAGLESNGDSKDPLSPIHAATMQRVLAFVDEGAALVESGKAPDEVSLQVLKTAERLDPSTAGKLALSLLGPDRPQALSLQAARTIAALADSNSAKQALADLPKYNQATRRELIAGMSGSKALATVVAEAIDDDLLSAADLLPEEREALLKNVSEELRPQLQKDFERTQLADRSEVLKQYASSLDIPGDSMRGAAVFRTHCLGCHRMQEQGHAVGPDLSGVASRAPGTLLEDILNPNREVAPDFGLFLAETNDGRTFSGVLVRETADSILLRRAEGVEDAIPRSQLAVFRAAGASPMPEGLERQITPAQMADLLQFLRKPERP